MLALMSSENKTNRHLSLTPFTTFAVDSLNKRLDEFFPCSCRYYMTMPNKNIAAVTESINQSINLLTSVRGMGLP